MRLCYLCVLNETFSLAVVAVPLVLGKRQVHMIHLVSSPPTWIFTDCLSSSLSLQDSNPASATVGQTLPCDISR